VHDVQLPPQMVLLSFEEINAGATSIQQSFLEMGKYRYRKYHGLSVALCD